MEELDQYQKAAATATETRIAVSACPGSGKTRTLVARLRNMIDVRHIPASEIVCLSFTRYAANEIRQRLDGRTGGAYIGTFHSFCLHLLMLYGRSHGWEPAWITILDESEAWADENLILKDLGILDHKGNWGKCKAGEWSAFTSTVLGDITQLDSEDHPALFRTAYKALMERLKAENVLTFGTLVLETCRMLEDHETLEKIRNRHGHILVDEVQDTDRNQWIIIDTLNPKTLCAVGDCDQAIFEWRNARPGLFIDYARRSALYDLPNSYRFGYSIAQPANALISNNSMRIDRAIQAIASNEGAVSVMHDVSYGETASIIRRHISQGVEPGEIAVLSRRHETLRELAAELDHAGDVPYLRIGGSDSISKSSEMRAIRGYARLAVNPQDRYAFSAIAAPEKLDTGRLREIRRQAVETRRSQFEVYKDSVDHAFPQNVEEIREYLRCRDPATDYSPAFAYIRSVTTYEGIADLQELVNYLAVESVQDQMRERKNLVTLCTIHAAKGLEWRVVLLVGMNAGRFPSRRAIREGRAEEERRLAFVAMTRAMETLYLVHTQDLANRQEGVSMFMFESGLFKQAEGICAV